MDQNIGKMLDNRYEILDLIGVGGMAGVYKAYCHRLHRLVAVKILRRELSSDADFRRRFYDEAQAVGMLSHPNIVAIYDVNHHENMDYIVMELIDGVTLKQYMQKKEDVLTWHEAIHYMSQIMCALSHAHSRGIIHRDIKPQNIMVLRDGSVRVADFGIARVVTAAQNTLTQDTLGSVHYISPEQAKGSHLDARADIYSAGVILYEMLTGRLPFEGDSPVAVAIQHINSIPLSPMELNPELPEGLEQITLKAMSAKMDKRYKNAEEMIADLEAFRKNPQMIFPYEHPSSSTKVDEPTMAVDVAEVKRMQKEWDAQKEQKRSEEVGISGTMLIEDEEDFEESYEEYENTREKKGGLIAVILVVILFLGGVGAFLWTYFFSDMMTEAEPLYVPSLLGLTLEEALDDSELLENFIIVEGATEYSDDYAPGEIMWQSPSGGNVALGDSTEITVKISAGEKEIVMPDVINQSYSQARVSLENMGFTVKEPEYEYNDTVTIHYVINSLPEVGTPMDEGDSVQLIVSRGAEIRFVSVPSLYTMTQEEAEKFLLEDYDLNCKFVEVHDSAEVGTVISQSIAVGTEVEVGTTITLQISKGPLPSATTDEEEDVEDEEFLEAGVTGDSSTEIKTKSISISLPEDKSTVLLQVLVGEEEQYNSSVNTSGGDVLVTISGSGRDTAYIYVDGFIYEQRDVDFDA